MTRRPDSTYRLQISAQFTLDDAASVTEYLRDLGASWAYLSPLLAAVPGSNHGYDVVDHSRVDEERGGADGLERFTAAARTAGLGILVDIVPNHVGVAVPRLNPWWWEVLRLGRESRHAVAFDIDWEAANGRLRLPILGGEPQETIARGELVVDTTPADDAPDGTLTYFDHVLPLAPGSGDHADDLPALLAAQHYELQYWEKQNTELNYRRFFAVVELAGIRVDLPDVFAESHREIVRWVRDGLADGIRVDHPDGLADPAGYLEQLADATGGVYTLVEKILEPGEPLPSWWRTDGTTGYDALAEIDRVLVDRDGLEELTRLDSQLRSQTGLPEALDWPDLIHATKRMVADEMLGSEVRRLIRTLPRGVVQAEDALAELLAGFPVYRSYLPEGLAHLQHAFAEARRRRPDLEAAFADLEPLLSDPSLEVAQRFQQTSGAVMAKGVEDTAFYRFTRLGSLTEVGADPSIAALSVDEFHEAQAARLAAWPHSMTTLSTHDTKRSEDVRARLAVLSEIPERWAEVLGQLRGVASTGHGPLDALIWQAAVGAWPLSSERLIAYATKAAREAAESTTWQHPDADFEAGLAEIARSIEGDARAVLDGFVAEIVDAGRSNSLSAKLLQLTGPGVPDVYQGSELWDLSLVDPDNRRPVDFAARARLLSELDADLTRGVLPPIDDSGRAKLLVTSRALRLRRDNPELFRIHRAAVVEGSAAAHAVAAHRGGVTAVSTRLPVGLVHRGGWGDTILMRADVAGIDVLTGRRIEPGPVRLADLLATYPVALIEDAR
ncbi:MULTISPECIES: malto-oligosyltrehalose synthase [unclassified Microbacterium]|uniref:malto-oligosyltrehalose synthase n=1 Tax=unclassified Microbacterium TaxID=2609290 RepID=UPI000EAABCC3|nr:MULTISPECIES: malto-oligosyltrehalose synthase [unclassified Microbacterium]MBT2484031.1 malto-oligosyltrehalose synthase [Microbacterium sp. ISL-108]RKN66988.1 malto-oligosyltrehalose synthase [Microbacterium sp. CGR2]